MRMKHQDVCGFRRHINIFCIYCIYVLTFIDKIQKVEVSNKLW